MAASATQLGKSKERGDEARRHDVRDEIQARAEPQASAMRVQQERAKNTSPSDERDFEGGFGGQEDLEDRYATTSGEH